MLENSNNNKPRRIRRSRRQIKRECNLIYELLMKGKTHQEIQTITGLSETTYFRYLRDLRKQHGKRFLELSDDENGELGLSTQILYDRLCELYTLCVIRLTKFADIDSKDYSETVAITQELSINLYRLRTQGVQAALEIARRATQMQQQKETLFESTIPKPEPTEDYRTIRGYHGIRKIDPTTGKALYVDIEGNPLT